jgi:hypothetical protein
VFLFCNFVVASEIQEKGMQIETSGGRQDHANRYNNRKNGNDSINADLLEDIN